MTEFRRLPAELTLTEAGLVLGVHRTNAYRRLRAAVRWGMHGGRRMRVVSTRAVLQVIATERNQGPALPEIDKLSERIAALLQVQERQALWAAKVARKLGIPV